MKELEELFKQGESLQAQMRALFKKNNLQSTHLEFLPKSDFEEWKKMHEKSNVLTKKICLIINKNKDE